MPDVDRSLSDIDMEDELVKDFGFSECLGLLAAVVSSRTGRCVAELHDKPGFYRKWLWRNVETGELVVTHDIGNSYCSFVGRVSEAELDSHDFEGINFDNLDEPEVIKMDKEHVMETERAVEFLNTDRWLSVSDSGKALKMEFLGDMVYAPVSLVTGLMGGERDRVLFSEPVEVPSESLLKESDVEFVETDISIRLSGSGKALLIRAGDRDPMVVPVSQVERLFRGEIKGARLSMVVER